MLEKDEIPANLINTSLYTVRHERMYLELTQTSTSCINDSSSAACSLVVAVNFAIAESFWSLDVGIESVRFAYRA